MEKALNYNYKVVKQFTIATVLWGVVGMLVDIEDVGNLATFLLSDAARMLTGNPAITSCVKLLLQRLIK